MDPGVTLLVGLAAAYMMTGIVFLLVWLFDPIVRVRLWFGLGALAAAGALAAWCVMPGMSGPAVVIVRQVAIMLGVAWLIAMTWFTIEYAGSDVLRRRLAALLTLIFAFVLTGYLVFPVLDSAAFPGARRPIGLLGGVALLGLLGFVVDGTIRLWRARERTRALTLGVGMGIVLASIGLHQILLGIGVVGLPPVPYAFLLIVLLMIYQLAGAVAETQSMSERLRQGFAHNSRLAIVGQLSATITHEINQPLGAILSNADAGEILLERADPPLDEIRQTFADIRRDGLRARDIVKHVRTLVRNPPVALEKLDANDVAKDVIGLVAPDARRRRIALMEDLDPMPAWIRGDRARLQQVLINLVLNALDAVDAAEGVRENRQPIVLGVSRTQHGQIEFRVVDAGVGIPAERLDRLFDASLHTSKAHGVGLGLSIARSIVEAHGGRIRAENNSDAGATFRVALPPFDEAGGR